MSKGSNFENDPKATWGDVIKGMALLALVALVMHMSIQEDRDFEEIEKTKSEIDSLARDSLSKTVKYQNAVQVTNKRFFDSIQRSY